MTKAERETKMRENKDKKDLQKIQGHSFPNVGGLMGAGGQFDMKQLMQTLQMLFQQQGFNNFQNSPRPQGQRPRFGMSGAQGGAPQMRPRMNTPAFQGQQPFRQNRPPFNGQQQNQYRPIQSQGGYQQRPPHGMGMQQNQ
jgi:hypothetical protein